MVVEEALLRELLRSIQAARKKEGLVVKDHIVLTLSNKELQKFDKEIREKVGASNIKYHANKGETVKFEGKKVSFLFEKVK